MKEANARTTVYEFEITLAGSPDVEAIADRVYEAGCDDATLASCNGVTVLGFDREAESLGEAIGTAVRDVLKAGLAIVRIDIESGVEQAKAV